MGHAAVVAFLLQCGCPPARPAGPAAQHGRLAVVQLCVRTAAPHFPRLRVVRLALRVAQHHRQVWGGRPSGERVGMDSKGGGFVIKLFALFLDPSSIYSRQPRNRWKILIKSKGKAEREWTPKMAFF